MVSLRTFLFDLVGYRFNRGGVVMQYNIRNTDFSHIKNC